MYSANQIIEVPIDALSAEALEGVVEEFVTRDGTDYGETECSFESKRQAVITQLRSGEVALVFDPETTTCNMVPRKELCSARTGRQ